MKKTDKILPYSKKPIVTNSKRGPNPNQKRKHINQKHNTYILNHKIENENYLQTFIKKKKRTRVITHQIQDCFDAL